MEEVCEVPAFETTSNEIKEILTSAKTVAVVGLSPNDDRDSNKVARYLIDEGYEIIPVNPNYEEVLGLNSYPSLSEISEDIDVWIYLESQVRFLRSLNRPFEKVRM